MQPFHLLASVTILACYVLQSFVGCSSHEEVSRHHKSIKENMKKGMISKLSPQMRSNITIHGFLLWASMGLLMPVGILTIRFMSNREESGRRGRVLFYLHAILQILSVLLATIGAVMSIKNFENSFNNNHQRLGLALYGAMWVQALIGFLRPHRGNKRRSTWYFVHWILGTTISLVGIINIYTGLQAYNKKTSRSTRLWTILFTAEVSFIAFFYLFQDRWDYMKKQGVILGNIAEPINAAAADDDDQVIAQRESTNPKVVLPEPCGKRKALQNLFN